MDFWDFLAFKTIMDDDDNTIGNIIADILIVIFLFGFGMLGISLVVTSPFFVLFNLDSFVETFVTNNLVFFIAVGVAISAVKLFSKNKSKLLNAILGIYVSIPIIYVCLYVLHFDTAIYAIARTVGEHMTVEQFTDSLVKYIPLEKIASVDDSNFVYIACNNIYDAFLNTIGWFMNLIENIDTSCFTVSLSEINIFSIIFTIFYSMLILFAMLIAGLVVAVPGILICLIALVGPYVAVGLTVFLLNRLVFNPLRKAMGKEV